MFKVHFKHGPKATAKPLIMYWYSPFDSRTAWISGLKMLKHSLVEARIFCAGCSACEDAESPGRLSAFR